MTNIEQLEITINQILQILLVKEVIDYLPRKKYLEGQLHVLVNYKSLVKLKNVLTIEDCVNYLTKIYNLAQLDQIKVAGFINTTGKPNNEACFYLGKMIACNRLKEDLLKSNG